MLKPDLENSAIPPFVIRAIDSNQLTYLFFVENALIGGYKKNAIGNNEIWDRWYLLFFFMLKESIYFLKTFYPFC